MANYKAIFGAKLVLVLVNWYFQEVLTKICCIYICFVVIYDLVSNELSF